MDTKFVYIFEYRRVFESAMLARAPNEDVNCTLKKHKSVNIYNRLGVHVIPLEEKIRLNQFILFFDSHVS